MATKHKHRMKPGANGLAQQAQRLLEKGDFKQALKDAKVCYRQEPGAETRQLLERAYLARSRQLHRAGLRLESQAIAQSLLELGVTDKSVERDLPELLIAVGLLDRAVAAGRGGSSLQEGDPLYVVAADHAVLRPEGAPASLPAIRQGAAAVRRALASLETGDEAQAMAVLKDIPRASPFADWKYLVRGLAAYYREDGAEMAANWERLDPGRFAARIAAPLKAVANPATVAGNGSGSIDRPVGLGNQIVGGTILERLQNLQDQILAGRWPDAVKLFRASVPVFRRMDSALPQRVGLVLYATFVRKGAPSALRQLAAAIEPPPIDPHWNRGLAMAWENDEDSYLSDVEDHWRGYLEDLAGLECLSPAERTLAQALVWLRLGKMMFEESRPICRTCGVCHEPDEEMQGRTVACLEMSLELAPELLKAHQALANALELWEKPEEAARAYRRLVERFPENLDALMSLANHHLNRDEPLAARDFLFRAQRLRPLDARIKATVHAARLASARHHAMTSRWDEGRAELAAVEKMADPPKATGKMPALAGTMPDLLVHQAVFEMKAGQRDLASRLFDQAKNELAQSAPVWLLATIESTRYCLPKADRDEFEARWVTAMKRNRTSVAAGEMCRILAGYLEAGVDYRGREQCVEFLLDFLRRCSWTKWQAGDLRNVLGLLMCLATATKDHAQGASKHTDPGGVLKLLAKLAAKARAKFPDNAFFQCLVGEMEIRKGPRKCRRRFARGCFQRAVDLTQGANDPDSIVIAKRAKEKILFLDECGLGGPDRYRRSAAGLPPMPMPDDIPSELADLIKELDDGGDGPSPGKAAGALFEMFARACRDAGINPERILDEMAGDMPFRFRPKGFPNATRKKGE